MIHDLPPELDRAQILAKFDGLPPVSAFLRATSDQESYLRTVREHFQDLKQALEAYFAGKPNPIGRYDTERKKFIELEASYYLDIYNLLWFGWTEIQSEVSQYWELEQSKYKFKSFPASPGETLALILELACEEMTNACLTEGRVSSYESYNLLQGMPDQNLAKGTQKKRVDRTLRYACEVSERSKAGSFLWFCETAVKKRLRGNLTLQTKLKRFQGSQSKRFSELKRTIKTEGIRGQRWLQGECKTLN